MKRYAIVTLTLTVALILQSHASAQKVPHKGKGSDAEFYPYGAMGIAPGTYRGSGKGTHLGKHFLEGRVAVDPATIKPPQQGVFLEAEFVPVGDQTQTAADGSKIISRLRRGKVKLTYTQGGLVEGKWEVKSDITGGTGRFKNASGEMTQTATNPPFDPSVFPWPFNWTFKESINLGRKK